MSCIHVEIGFSGLRLVQLNTPWVLYVHNIFCNILVAEHIVLQLVLPWTFASRNRWHKISNAKRKRKWLSINLELIFIINWEACQKKRSQQYWKTHSHSQLFCFKYTHTIIVLSKQHLCKTINSMLHFTFKSKAHKTIRSNWVGGYGIVKIMLGK